MQIYNIGNQIELPGKIKHIGNIQYGEALARFRVSTIEVLIFSDNKLLILKRKEDPLNGGWWLCGTKLIGGESFEEGAQRALRKELGLEVELSRFELLPISQLINWEPSITAPYGEHNQHNFACIKLNIDEVRIIKLHKEEHSEMEWVTLNIIVSSNSKYIGPLIDICSFTQKYSSSEVGKS